MHVSCHGYNEILARYWLMRRELKGFAYHNQFGNKDLDGK